MARRPALRAVKADEQIARPPQNLVEAADGTRRDLLTVARRRLAAEIDGGGVPGHALGRVMSELAKLDAEIRAMDAREREQQEEAESDASGAYKWDPEAI